MKLLKTKTWCWLDIGLLKWSCILFGMVAGAYCADFVMRYVWVFLAVAWLCAVKPAIDYLTDKC